MGIAIGFVLAGILVACLLLYVAWKIIEALDNRRVRRRSEARYNAGESRFCRWYVDDEGKWGRVITKSPPR